jgi:hypothetical protein
LSSKRHHNASDSGKGLTPTPSPVCTRVCTSEPENANAGRVPSGCDADQGDEGEGTDRKPADQGDPLAKLAAALLTLSLSPADRERLAALLTREDDGQR